jgi:hypothetical protein
MVADNSSDIPEKLMEDATNETIANVKRIVVGIFRAESPTTTLELKWFPSIRSLSIWLARWCTHERFDMNKVEMEIYEQSRNSTPNVKVKHVLSNCIEQWKKTVPSGMQQEEALDLLTRSFLHSPNGNVYVALDIHYNIGFFLCPSEPIKFNGRMKIQRIGTKYLVTPYGRPLID